MRAPLRRAKEVQINALEILASTAGALAGVLAAPGDWSECLQGSGVLSRDITICLAKD